MSAKKFGGGGGGKGSKDASQAEGPSLAEMWSFGSNTDVQAEVAREPQTAQEADRQTSVLDAVARDNGYQDARQADEQLEGGFTPPHVDTSGIEEALSYSPGDWVVFDSDVQTALDGFRGAGSAEGLRQAVRQVDPALIERMYENMPDDMRERNSRLIELIEDARANVALDGGQQAIAEQDMQLFVDGIDADDVIQDSEMNDCYMVSALASAAEQDPGFVRDMVHDNGDGSYRVRLYDRNEAGDLVPTWVTVDQLPMDGNTPDYTHSDDMAGGRREAWPSIVERAYAELNGGYSEINWGNSAEGHAALFGSEGTRVDLSGDNAGDFSDVEGAVNGGNAVVASTGSHVVTVMGTTTGENGEQMVTIRDQLAEGDEGDRVQTMTWAQFQQTYSYVRHTEIPDREYNDGIRPTGDTRAA